MHFSISVLKHWVIRLIYWYCSSIFSFLACLKQFLFRIMLWVCWLRHTSTYNLNYLSKETPKSSTLSQLHYTVLVVFVRNSADKLLEFLIRVFWFWCIEMRKEVFFGFGGESFDNRFCIFGYFWENEVDFLNIALDCSLSFEANKTFSQSPSFDSETDPQFEGSSNASWHFRQSLPMSSSLLRARQTYSPFTTFSSILK